jgi:hypothetical protein
MPSARRSTGACAYVGDMMSRDVIGAWGAGYGLVIQIKSLLTDKADRTIDVCCPMPSFTI